MSIGGCSRSELGPDVTFGTVDDVALLGDACCNAARAGVEVPALHEVLVPVRARVGHLEVDPLVHVGQLVEVDRVVQRDAEAVAVQRQAVEVRDGEQEVRVRQVREGHVVVAGVGCRGDVLGDAVRMVGLQGRLVARLLRRRDGLSHLDEVVELVRVSCGVEHVLGELVLHGAVLECVHVLVHGGCVLEPVGQQGIAAELLGAQDLSLEERGGLFVLVRVRLRALQRRNGLPVLQRVVLLGALDGKQDHRREDQLVVLVRTDLLVDEVPAIAQVLHMVRDLGARVATLDEVRVQRGGEEVQWHGVQRRQQRLRHQRPAKRALGPHGRCRQVPRYKTGRRQRNKLQYFLQVGHGHLGSAHCWFLSCPVCVCSVLLCCGEPTHSLSARMAAALYPAGAVFVVLGSKLGLRPSLPEGRITLCVGVVRGGMSKACCWWLGRVRTLCAGIYMTTIGRGSRQGVASQFGLQRVGP